MTVRDRIKVFDPVVLVAVVVVVVGVCWLYSAVTRAVPLVDWGSKAEEETAREARPQVYAASGVIGFGALALLARGRRIAGLLVAPAAVLPAILLAFTPASLALPLLAALITLPLAVGAGIAALFTRRRVR